MIQIGGLSYWLSGNGLEGGLRAGLRNTLLHPGFHFAFEPAGAASELDGFRKQPVANQFIKPLVRHAGVRGDEGHVDKRIFCAK